MKPLKATIGTSQPVMSAQDFDNVFFRVNELHDIHASFYENLKPRLDVWSADTGVGDLFKKLVRAFEAFCVLSVTTDVHAAGRGAWA